MNKALIKKYKTEFEHWLNGGKLLIKLSTGWEPIPLDYAWHLPSKLIIIDDCYSTYRKALAEGKQVQVDINYWAFPETGTKNYQDLPIAFTDWNKYSVECYRIKPGEPKFKVGDWVVVKDTPIKVTEAHIKDSSCFTVPQCCGSKCYSLSNVKLWQPKPGEWCWFLNKGKAPILMQFHSLEADGNRKYSAIFPNMPHPFIAYYDYCEPFLGTLPSTIKN